MWPSVCYCGCLLCSIRCSFLLSYIITNNYLQSANPCTISVNGEEPEVAHQSKFPLLYFLTSEGDIQWPSWWIPTSSLSVPGNMLPISISPSLSQRVVEEGLGPGGSEKRIGIVTAQSQKKKREEWNYWKRESVQWDTAAACRLMVSSSFFPWLSLDEEWYVALFAESQQTRPFRQPFLLFSLLQPFKMNVDAFVLLLSLFLLFSFPNDNEDSAWPLHATL